MSPPAAIPASYPPLAHPNSKRVRRKALRVLDRALGLRHGERRPVLMMWAYSFSLGVAVAYLTSAALPIFLAAFTIRLFPYVILIAALAELGVGYITELAEKRIPRSQISSFVLLGIVALTLVCFGMLSLAPLYLPAFAVLVWAYIQRSLIPGEFWGLSALLFDVRESKRLFSLIDSGAIVAKILGYFSVPLLLPFLPLRSLLLFSTAGAVAAYFIVVRLRRRYRLALDYSSHTSLFHRHGLSLRAETAHPIALEHHASSEHEEEHFSVLHETLTFIRENSYVRTIAVVSFLAIIGMNVIDYGFLREIELKFAQQQRMASVLALFFGVAEVLCFAIKMGLAGRLFSRFGPVRMSGAFPVILLSISILTLLSSANRQWAIWFFTLQA
ncbi:MAG: hypothetical protein ACHQNE_06425, partial [Candidatus Kapaibacterium sp.]